MNRKKLLMFGLPLLVVTLIAAAIYIQIVSVDVDATIDEALSVTDVSMSFTGYPGETITEDIIIDNAAQVPLNVELSWVETSNEALFSLDNSEGTCLPYPSDTCEKRVIINEQMLLSELSSISWDANTISGYVSHIDVLIDTNDDGIKDDALVFEYAKDLSNCEVTPYPLGEISMSIDGNTLAWLSSGDAGPGCVAVGNFYIDTLDNWIVGYNGIDGDTKVIGFELEVDNWISTSNSDVWNIAINGNEIKVDYELITTSAIIPNGLGNEIPVSFLINTASPVGEFAGKINIARV